MRNITVLWQLKWAMLIIMTSVLSGCFSWGWGSDDGAANGLEPHQYIVDVDRGATAQQFARHRVLLIKPVKVVPHFQDKAIVFRIGENEYQAQTDHQLFSTPDEMFTSQLQRWLKRSGLFSQVIVGDESANADMVLESAVTALYGEARTTYPPQAVIEMQFFLSDAKDAENLLFQTGLRVDANIDETTASNVVKGWKQGLEELLATLELDMSDFFSKRDDG